MAGKRDRAHTGKALNRLMTSELTADGQRHHLLNDALIVCTLERPAVLARCLESVRAQTHVPLSIRVVDASCSDSTKELVSQLTDQLWPGQLLHQPCEAGLTRQRNAGVRALGSEVEVVHFIDDDTVLEPTYFEAVLQTFAADREGEVKGVGGLVTNIHCRRASLGKRLFLLDGPPGSVLRSGRTPVALDFDRLTDVDWLSGCSMSYRREVFQDFAFNESLSGYGLGEDSEFSYRVRQTGRLLIQPAARLEHLEKGHNETEAADYTFMELVNRARRVSARTGILRMGWYWWSVFGEVVGLAASALHPRGNLARLRLSKAMSAVRHVLSDSRPTRLAADAALMVDNQPSSE